MKRIMFLALMGITLSVVMASCGSSKGGHCDAYGSVNQTTSSDVASK